MGTSGMSLAVSGMGDDQMRFDPVMNWGHILTATVFFFTSIISVFAAYSTVQRTTDMQGIRIDRLEQATIGVQLAQGKLYDALATIREDVATIRTRQMQRPPPPFAKE